MNKTYKTQEVIEAESQLSPEQMKEHLGKLIAESPSRQRGRYTPAFDLTPEYEALLAVDTSHMSDRQAEEHANKLFRLKKFGFYGDEERQRDISHSLEIPLSEVFKLRNTYMEEVEKLEHEIDSFNTDAIQSEVDQLTAEYRERMRGANSHQRVKLSDDYNKAVDALEFKKVTLPKNDLKVKRAEAIEKYKVYDNRIKLYVSTNRTAIERQIEVARDREISENLLALAEYLGG